LDAAWEDAGSEMQNAVPLRPGLVVLRLLMVPWCLSTMAFEMANPSPVPCSFLVVKNGSNIFSAMDAGIPGPLSATTPDAKMQRATDGQRVHRVANQIREHLQHLSRVRFHGNVAAQTLVEPDLFFGNAFLVDAKRGFGKRRD
jgi:hypothetical protein